MVRWCLILVLGWAALAASGLDAPAQGPQRPLAIGFRNDVKITVIVQGATVVNGMQRRGQPLRIEPTKAGYDINLPPGIRFITIYDANQPSRVLLRDLPVPVGQGDLFFAIRSAPGGQARVILVPDKNP